MKRFLVLFRGDIISQPLQLFVWCVDTAFAARRRCFMFSEYVSLVRSKLRAVESLL